MQNINRTSVLSIFGKDHACANVFLGVNYLILFCVFGNSIQIYSIGGTSQILYDILLISTYSFVYLLPAIALVYLRDYIAKRKLTVVWIPYGIDILLVLTATIVVALCYVDTRILDLYGFHLNAFVLNLVLTPGGIESLGGSDATIYSAIAGLLGLLAAQTLLYWFTAYRSRPVWRPQVKFLVVAFVCLSVTERLTYATADFNYYAPILETAQKIPFYNEVRFRTLGQRLGFDRPERLGIALNNRASELDYPKQKITTLEKPRPNIIWLIAESLRADMLTPAIMPQSYEFAGESLHFINHYSGGNGTRQGMFSLFYGLHGSYWNSFLNANQGPIVFDILKSNDYEFGMYTGATFTYPEFDRTVFAQLPSAVLHQLDDAVPPEIRDARNVKSMISQLEARDRHRPFAGMIFFESTHARYFFDDSDIIATPFVEDLNYVTMTRDSLNAEMEGLKNRYINASRHVDNQIGRLLVYLKREQILNDTIVVITGDHGEEFMEQGHWGHNNGFSEEQVRVPFVMHIPGAGNKAITHRTSHTDFIPTLLPMLGVTNPVTDYALGVSLLNSNPANYSVISSTSSICYVNQTFKFTIPLEASNGEANQLTRLNDQADNNVIAFFDSEALQLRAALDETRLFLDSGH
ncbi:MAG: sulfatase-like hydrolase/transferase [Pseudomonadales bacterium]